MWIDDPARAVSMSHAAPDGGANLGRSPTGLGVSHAAPDGGATLGRSPRLYHIAPSGLYHIAPSGLSHFYFSISN